MVGKDDEQVNSRPRSVMALLTALPWSSLFSTQPSA